MYTDTHRHFVQYMLKRGSVTKTKAFIALAKLNSGMLELPFLLAFVDYYY